MFLRTEILTEKQLIGVMTKTSFSKNITFELWRSFMPRRKEINALNALLYSVEVYEEGFFEHFNPSKTFENWAAMEVAAFTRIPDGMQSLVFPEGLYAVFLHKGLVINAVETYNYIFREWLPNSKFSIANRPHFAMMGEKYKPDNPDSEEEIWIPIQ